MLEYTRKESVGSQGHTRKKHAGTPEKNMLGHPKKHVGTPEKNMLGHPKKTCWDTRKKTWCMKHTRKKHAGTLVENVVHGSWNTPIKNMVHGTHPQL